MELDLRSILEELVILRADAMDAFAGKDSIYQSCLKEEDETWKQCKKAGIKMTKELDLYLGASLSSHGRYADLMYMAGFQDCLAIIKNCYK